MKRIPGPRCKRVKECNHYQTLGHCGSENNTENWCNASIEIEVEDKK